MKYKSEIFEVIHQDATANFEIGAISATEMREYDEMCLAQEPETAKEIAETTKTEHITMDEILEGIKQGREDREYKKEKTL